MAISREDKADVKSHMGKALANKVAKVTKDSPLKDFKSYSGGKSQWMKEDKQNKDYAPGGKYHVKPKKEPVQISKEVMAKFTHKGEEKTMPIRQFKSKEEASKAGYYKTDPKPKKHSYLFEQERIRSGYGE